MVSARNREHDRGPDRRHSAGYPASRARFVLFLGHINGDERLDVLGQFGNARPLLRVWLVGRAENAGLELVPQAGQFGQVTMR